MRIIVPLLLYVGILGLFSMNLYYYNSHIEYFIAYPDSDYDGVPYITGCSDTLHYFDATDKIKIKDQYCTVVAGKEMYIKEASPIVYYSIQYQWYMIIALLIYYFVSERVFLRQLLEKIKQWIE